MNKIKKIDVVCQECGSREVLWDSVSRWDVERQCWGFHQLCDFGQCQECGSIDTDTVDLNCPKSEKILIGLGYKKRSGKDTVADMLVKDHGFTKVSFAEPLKDLCEAILLLRTRDFKGLHGELFGWYQEYDASYFGGENFADDMVELILAETLKDPTLFDLDEAGKPRKLLQFVGTDCLRKRDESFWINVLFSQNLPDRVVITDVRFPNELAAIKNYKGSTVLINRDTGLSDTHSSENMLINATWDYIIDNNGSLKDLETQVTDLIEEIYDAAD